MEEIINKEQRVVVIGAGQSASSLAFKLRALGHEGPIVLLGDEPALPYQRPPLSKAYLLGDMTRERLFLKPESAYIDANISVRLGTRVQRIDRERCEVVLDSETVPYDALIMATGARPIKLPDEMGGALQGVYCVRTLEDIDAMAPEVTQGRRVLIVGGGYIGLEAAAVAAKLGLEVTVVEMADRILQRVAAPQTADYFRALHEGNGVQILEGVGLSALIGSTDVTQARLSNDQILDVDFVITGIGVHPNTQLADDAGLALDNGIKTDTHGRTSDPRIWAAGDCASFPLKGGQIRLESVPNAIEQAEAVAANIMGADLPYVAKPWFWSDQYDVKLQIAGLNTGYDHVVTRAGDREGSASHWYYKGEELLAIDAMNAPRDYMIGKRLLEAGKSPAPATIASPDTVLKSLL